MGKPTKEQVETYLEFFELIRMDPEMRKATKWFNTEFEEVSYEEFNKKYPVGSDGHWYFMVYYRYMETMGQLVYDEAIPINYVIDAFGSTMFPKAKPYFEGRRKDNDNPLLGENWQYMAQKAGDYFESREKKPRY